MLNDRENILSALREKPLKVYEIMKRANVVNEEACQSLLLKMRDEGLVNSIFTRGDGSSHDPLKWSHDFVEAQTHDGPQAQAHDVDRRVYSLSPSLWVRFTATERPEGAPLTGY